MMKKTWKKALSAILTVAMVASSFSGFAAEVKAADNGKVAVAVEGDSVVIGNGYISREFSTADDKLSTVEITNKRTDGGDTVFTPAEGSEEFIIKVTKEGVTATPSLPALDRTGWTAKADSYQNRSGASDGPASNILDGNVNSIWHSAYNSSGATPNDQQYPHNVVINMGKEVTFKSFSYTPRQEGEATNGNVLTYELYASTSTEELGYGEEGWTQIAKGKFEYNGVAPIYVNLKEECTATQLKFVALSANNGQNFGACAEFNLHADALVTETNVRYFGASALELDGEPVVEETSAVINGAEKVGQKVTFSFKPYTFKDATWEIKEVVVMYDGDHYMRKFMEIELDNKDLAIDYIDLESFNVADVPEEAQWTIPTNAGGIVQMEAFKANLGQPIYIDGMFFGAEFPATDTQIVDETGYIRYYTGKTFEQFADGNQLTTDGKYVTWQTVAGAARSATDLQVIQADFFEYIYDIATPSDFRIQYNSWFDNMMLISDEQILESFIEMDRELNAVEVRPLDSYVMDDGWINYNNTYVVDANRAGTTLNETGFWEFNSKFPNDLTPSSELVQKFGSDFGIWVGPRGGYNFYGHLADIVAKSGKGSKAGGSIDVADSVYHDNLTEMFVKWQKDYGVNYWKWDGFADSGQYGAFPAQDGVPGYANRHMTGGYKGMYHVTDLWEGWIDIMEALRQSEKDHDINKLWFSLTCYVNPSPWFLQWANSVWIQCIHDQADAGSSSSKMDRQMTYRDACYYDFINNHQFQFPLANVYNHDPIYGVEGTGMNKNTATDEQFQNYLYAQSARGTAFWELYFSDSIMTGDKYEVTAEFLAWAEENNHMLRKAKMFGGDPFSGVRLGSVSGNGTTDAYGFAGFDGYDGIITIRNSAQTPKTLTMTFDRALGVPEDAGTLKYHLEHTHNLTAGTPTTGEFTYGEEYTFTLQADEVRMFRVSKDGDTTAPEFTRAFADGGKVVTVKFNEKVTGNEFTVAGAAIESVEQSADDITYRITLAEAPADNAVVEISAVNIVDMAGNACTDSVSFVYNKGNIVATGAVAAADSLSGDNGFTVAATVETAAAGTVVAQGDAYELAINEEGYATFTLNGATAVSDVAVSDGSTIVGVKENNGIQKIYVDGTLAGSAYDADNRFYVVEQADITVANAAQVRVLDTAYGYDLVPNVYNAVEEEESLQLENLTATATGTSEGNTADMFDGDPTTFWTSEQVSSIAAGNPNVVVDLGAVYKINKVDYTPRFYNGTANYWWCTGNIKKLVVEISVDGENWTAVTPEGGLDISDKIVNEADMSLFPVSVEFEKAEAKYVRISGTESYHWQYGQSGQPNNTNKFITVGELAVFKAPTPKPVELPLESYVATTAGDEELDGGAAEGPAVLATDGDEGTKWHTDWYVGPNHDNHWLQVELDDVYAVSGYKYLPRQDSSPNGRITKYQIKVSVDGENWTVAAEGTWDTTTDWKEVSFEPQSAKYVRLQTIEATSDQSLKFASAAEVRVVAYVGETPDTPDVPDVPTVNKNALDAAIKAAKALNEADYTAESWAAADLAGAIAAAEAVFANEEATQDDVDAAVVALQAVVDSLVEAPKAENLALNKDAVARYTADDSASGTNTERPLSMAVDGIIPSNVNTNYGEFGKDNDRASQYLQVDLGKLCDIESVSLYRYWVDGRTYGDTVIAVADKEEDFAEGKATIIYNADDANVHGLGAGEDADYAESSAGKSWTAPEGTTGRYVRVYTYGVSGGGTTNHIVELEVMGFEKADVPVEPEIPETEVCRVYADVEHGAWYETAVQYVSDKGIMTGNEGLFSPDAMVTRAVMVETLYKMEGRPEVTDFAAYDEMTDVAADAWYKNSVAWGMNNNIVTGDTYFMTFSPNANVTREQLATFLYRYANFKGIDTTLSGTVEELLGDASVSEWAKEAFAWAVETGLIAGVPTSDGEGNTYYALHPQGEATRAQLATILSRFAE